MTNRYQENKERTEDRFGAVTVTFLEYFWILAVSLFCYTCCGCFGWYYFVFI